MKEVDGLEPAIVHKEAITQEDRARLAEYFEDVLRANDPIKLSMYTWYWIWSSAALPRKDKLKGINKLSRNHPDVHSVKCSGESCASWNTVILENLVS